MAYGDMYQGLREVDRGINDIRSIATEINRKTYAEKSVPGVVREATTAIKNIIDAGPFGAVTLQAEGDEVCVPNIQTTFDENVLGFGVDQENPHIHPTNLVPAEGIYESITVGRQEVTDDDQIRLGTRMYLKAKSSSIDVPMMGQPFVRFTRTDFISFPMEKNADVRIGVRQLETLRETKEALVDLSKSGLKRSIYAKKLKALGRALASEENTFIRLEKTELLHSIGRLGKAHADTIGWRDNRITEPLSKILGTGRLLTIESGCILSIDGEGDLCSTEGRVSGRIVDVCSQLQGFECDTLLAVIADNNDSSVQGYIPLDQIREFWF